MNELMLRRSCRRLTGELISWQKAAIGLVLLSALWNMGQLLWINELEAARREAELQRMQAELARDRALEQAEAAALRLEQDRKARAEQSAAYEAVGAYQYIGLCTITAYCPCEECCGQWADGVTAAGLPAEPGIVAVDPKVIPLGSTVIIDGQRYLAADTGVRGLAVDVCMADHAETVEFGVQAAEVWVTAP